MSCKQRRAVEPNPVDTRDIRQLYLAKNCFPCSRVLGGSYRRFLKTVVIQRGNERKLLYLGLSTGSLMFCDLSQIGSRCLNEIVHMLVISGKCVCFLCKHPKLCIHGLVLAIAPHGMSNALT